MFHMQVTGSLRLARSSRLWSMSQDSTIDIKPRSRAVTDGIHAAPARGMFRAVGMGDDDFAKPQIGVASS